jgi:hypothetical protein
VREGLALCAHLAALAPGPAPFSSPSGEILDWYDGPIVAVVRCRACGACGWLELVDWDPRRPVRVFALAALRVADVALYFRARAHGSCDVARSRAELEALAASAGPFERVVALEQWPELRIVAVSEPAAGLAAPGGASIERLPALEDGRWFARLGLAREEPR